MLLPRFCSVFCLLWIVAVAATGCGRRSETPDDPYDRISVPPTVGEAWRLQRDLLDGPPPEAPRDGDLRLFYALRNALHDPQRREAAADTFYAAWGRSPDHPLWLELAITKRRFLARPEESERLFTVATSTDTASAAHHFAVARRDWGRDDAAGTHFRLAAETADPHTLLGVWSALRLARIEHDAGDVDAAFARMTGLIPAAWAVGGPLLAGTVWQDLSFLARRSSRLGVSLLAAHAAETCAAAADDGFTRTRARLAVGRAHLARFEFEAAYDTFAACARVAGDSSFHRWLKDSAGLMARAARLSGDPDLEQANLLTAHNAALASGDTNGVILSRVALGSGERRLGRWPEAERWFAEAGRANAAWSGPDLGDRIARERANLLTEQGRYAQAESLRLAWQDRHASDWYGRGALETWVDLLHQALETDRPDLAYRALAEARKLPPPPVAPGVSYDPVLQLEVAAARFHARQGELHLADAALARAGERGAGAGPDAAWYVVQARGLVARAGGDDDTAASAFGECLTLAEQAGVPDLIRRSRVQLGAHLLERGDPRAAEELFAGDHDAPGYWTRVNARLLTGMCRARQGDPDGAELRFASVDSLLGPAAPRDLRARLRLEQARILRDAGRHDEALDHLAEARAASGGPEAGATDIGRSFGRAIEREIAEETLITLHDHPTLAAGSRWDRARDVAAWGRGADAGAVSSRGANARLEHFVGEHRFFTWVVPGSGSRGEWSSGDAARLRDLVAAVQTDMSYPGREVDAASVRMLGELVLQPAAESWAAGAELEMVADGALAGLPWSALPVLVDGSRKPALEHGPIVLVAEGGPAGAASAGRDGLLALGADGQAAAGVVLRNAEREAAAVADAWPGPVDLRLGDDARWPDLRRGGAAGYRAVHIASHLRVYEGADGRSTIRVAGLEDGAPLTLPEVPRLGADADLIYLSGCEGARRHRVAGQGVTSFAEAFLAGGAGAVVASSVLMDDEAAAHLATTFYRHWLRGMERAAALRAALLELRRSDPRWEHPFYWAFTQLYRAG